MLWTRSRWGRADRTRSRGTPMRLEALEDRTLLSDVGDTLATALNTALKPGSALAYQSGVRAIGDNATYGAKDVDLYKFTATVASSLTATTALPAGGNAMDTQLRLFDSTGHELAFNNDSGGGLYSRLIYRFTTGGTYFIGVAGTNNRSYDPTVAGSGIAGSVGNYTLTLDMDAPDTLRHAINTGVAAGMKQVFFTGTIGDNPYATTAEVDFYRLKAPAGGTIRAITSRPAGVNIDMDTELRLFDSTGHELAFNDDANGTTYSEIDFAVRGGGTYYIGVSGFNNRSYNPLVENSGSATSQTGSYRLALEVDVPDTIPNAVVGVAQPGGSATRYGSIGDNQYFLGDVDFYSIEANADTTLTATASPTAGSPSPIYGPGLELFDSSGNVLAYDTLVNSTTSSQIVYTFAAPGTYYIGVSGNEFDIYDPFTAGTNLGSDGTGDYTLKLSTTGGTVTG